MIAIIGAGGIGDVVQTLQAATRFQKANVGQTAHVYVNSHQEIVDFVQNCTEFQAFKCPDRHNAFPDPENPLNLPAAFLDGLFKEYDQVYSCHPDSLGQAPFAFPWYDYTKNYKAFLQTKVEIHGLHVPIGVDKSTKNIFIHPTSVTMNKNYSLQDLQRLVDLFAATKYNLIIARTSKWKGTPLPFFCQGRFYDLVDEPIDKVVGVMQQCDYFLGIDSGLSHIAYHLELPRITLQHQFGQPFHIVRYQNDLTDCLPLNTSPDVLFHRIMLNLRDPLTVALSSNMQIPYNINTKQLLYKKYYD